MNLLGSSSFDLRKAPNARERTMFFVALLAFVLGFYKACIVESSNTLASLQADLEKAKAEQDRLAQARKAAMTTLPALNTTRAEAEKITWVGKAPNMALASDTMLQSAHEDGVVLVRYAVADTKEKDKYLIKSLSLTLSGPLKNLDAYLEKSEHLSVPFVVERFMLNPSSDFAELLTLRLEGGFYATK